MYSPHTVSLISFHHETPQLTILRGVMLQTLNGRSVLRRGAAEENSVTLFVPFSVRAFNAAEDTVTFLPALQYLACVNPEAHWTLQPEGEGAGRASFFVKGELPGACSLREARELYDFVYVVAGFYVRDYGSRALRHWKVISKVSSRYYHYGN